MKIALAYITGSLSCARKHNCNMQATPLPTKQALQVPSLDHRDAICLGYKLKWPLHILLTPEVVHTLSEHPCFTKYFWNNPVRDKKQ